MTGKTWRWRWSWGTGASSWPVVLWFVAVLVVLESVHGLGAGWLRWRVTTPWNPAFLEGLSWWHGQLSLPYRLWDTAYVAETGKVYNVFPPLQSIIGFVATAPGQLSADLRAPPEMRVLPLVLYGLPLPLVGYWVFYRRTGRGIGDCGLGIGDCGPEGVNRRSSAINRQSAWAAVLTIGWLGGTAVLPCLDEARHDGVHHINHLLSQIGLLLLAGELLGRRRLWLMLLSLLIAAWSRQLTGVFAVALLAVVWRGEPTKRRNGEAAKWRGVEASKRHNGASLVRGTWTASRAWWMAVALVGLAVIAAVPMGLNWAKFGSPLRNGYELIYVGRDHALAASTRAHGLFSAAFLGRNAYYMNLAVPWGTAERGTLSWQPSEYGTSMWLTTPLLVLILLGVRTWWREVPARILMLCSMVIIAALLVYHGTGQRQYGYYRFALDFIPVWFVVGAPWLTTGWRRWATLACVAWSVAYFAMLGRWAVGVA
ncbi:MAG: hypothetical protein JXQ75_15850 [Phycisphaerae bacterium]|nr:hypothetical protein [Phycisphaerae bacterium]